MASRALGDPVESFRPADARALRRGLLRLHAAAVPPWLHAEAARRMAERLVLIKLPPRRVLDWWAPMSASREILQRVLPAAHVVEVLADGAVPPPRRRDRLTWLPGRRRQPPPLGESELEAAAVDLLWSNMGLHWSADPPALLARWRQAIAVDGFLMFSTLGPGTLIELAQLYRGCRWGPALAPLVDMHDLGDMLVRAGFADPVMDQETLTLTWPTPMALLAELRQLGLNADPTRHAGLRTPRWRDRLLEALAERRDGQGRIAMSFELVYGHAFCPRPSAAVASETRVALEDFRAMARARGGSSGRR